MLSAMEPTWNQQCKDQKVDESDYIYGVSADILPEGQDKSIAARCLDADERLQGLEKVTAPPL